jgi:hypothetical protein
LCALNPQIFSAYKSPPSPVLIIAKPFRFFSVLIMAALTSDDKSLFLNLTLDSISLSESLGQEADSTYGYVRPSSNLPKAPAKPVSSIGEMLWTNGGTYSDVQISLSKCQQLLKDTAIPETLQLHSIVLYQSGYFKRLLATPTTMQNLTLAPHKTKENIFHLYTAIKLMYTKSWELELNSDNAKGILAACTELEYDEGIHAVNEWIMFNGNKSQESPRSTLGSPRVSQEIDSVDSGVSDIGSAKSSPSIRAVSVTKPRPHVHHVKQPSAPLVPMNPQELYRQLTSPLSHPESRLSLMQQHISTFERISHQNMHHCLQRHFDTCFPFDANLYCATMDSILTLRQQNQLSSSDAAKSIIRLLGVMRNDQTHEAQSHTPILHIMQSQEPVQICSHPPVVPVAMDVILIEIMTNMDANDRLEIASYLAGLSVRRNIQHLRQIKGDETINWEEVERERTEKNTAWIVSDELHHYISQIA